GSAVADVAVGAELVERAVKVKVHQKVAPGADFLDAAALRGGDRGVDVAALGANAVDVAGDGDLAGDVVLRLDLAQRAVRPGDVNLDPIDAALLGADLAGFAGGEQREAGDVVLGFDAIDAA